jgi:hypothetical protein
MWSVLTACSYSSVHVMLDETVSHFSTNNELMMCEVLEFGGYYFDDEQSLIYEPLPIYP